MSNKTKKELEKEISELKKAKEEITFADVKALALKYGAKTADQAEKWAAEALKKAESKVVEKFNEKSGKLIVSAVEVAFNLKQKFEGWKKKAEEKLKR